MSKMFEKKKGSKMSDTEMGAKKSVLESLRDEMSKAMGDKLSGLKKVTVASDSKEGLQNGLSTAKNMVEGGKGGTVGDSYGHELEKAVEDDEMDTHPTDNSDDNDEAEAEGPIGEEDESPEEESHEEGEDMSHEEIDAKLKHLLALKKKKESHK